MLDVQALLGDRAAIVCSTEGCRDDISVSQLKASVSELSTGLQGMLGNETYTVSLMMERPVPAGTKLVAAVVAESELPLGPEGFRIVQNQAAVHIEACTASGLLYGVFRLLSMLQQHKDIPESFETEPQMALRVWDLWVWMQSPRKGPER